MTTDPTSLIIEATQTGKLIWEQGIDRWRHAYLKPDEATAPKIEAKIGYPALVFVDDTRTCIYNPVKALKLYLAIRNNMISHLTQKLAVKLGDGQ